MQNNAQTLLVNDVQLTVISYEEMGQTIWEALDVNGQRVRKALSFAGLQSSLRACFRGITPEAVVMWNTKTEDAWESADQDNGELARLKEKILHAVLKQGKKKLTCRNKEQKDLLKLALKEIWAERNAQGLEWPFTKVILKEVK